MQVKGKITFWNDEKGFGFIEPFTGGQKVFLHIKALRNRDLRPEVGNLITYTLATDKQGRPSATQATLAGAPVPKKTKNRSSSLKNTLTTGIAVLFMTAVGISVLAGKIPGLVLALYIAASMLTFLLYALDKSAAKKGAWRTKESTLHLFALIGGWPGAMIAQQKLRHKSKKTSFRAVFWVTVLLNCSAFLWLFTPTGSSTARHLIASLT